MKLEINSFVDAEELFRQGLNMTEIRQYLESQGINETELEQQMQKVKLLRQQKQTRIGFACIGLGALLCMTSCLLTLFHDYSAVYVAFILYGMTMAGACLVLSGLAFIFGI